MKNNKPKIMKNYKFAEVTATNGKITRTEKINLVSNEIFKNLKTPSKIKKAYEEFWNYDIKVTDVKLLNN
jgi:hypothetical protein